MPLTSDRDIKLLTKLAEKRGFPGDINRMRKLVSAHAIRSHVSPQAALAFLAIEAGIGTRVYEKAFDPTEQVQLREMHSKQSKATESIKPQKKQNTKRKIIRLIDYETENHFIKGHIDELNLAYTSACYTSVFILARKIIENLIIDILRKKYPESIRENKDLYFDTARAHLKDFEVILKNLNSKKTSSVVKTKQLRNYAGKLRNLKTMPITKHIHGIIL